MPMPLSDVETLVREIFEENGTGSIAAASVSRALVQAEAAGQYGHGLRRVVPYVGQLRSGKVDGRAIPSASHRRPAVVEIDAAFGFAYPAIDLAVSTLPEVARTQGIAIATIGRSHHAGVAGLAVERLAERGFDGNHGRQRTCLYGTLGRPEAHLRNQSDRLCRTRGR
ncbi:LDH2 family malate/lactate/ureidoglycolate dehydrogenase [Pseudorhizobium tarimense]|uniref:LDH2 family malate/lactate/ureidoglycolate dehydrogenase n=1 Tax=Pseudorhizobium tarimense TaxID=1079109 RepID=A0ABV2H294_9HYPH